jgi:hypothetical protein
MFYSVSAPLPVAFCDAVFRMFSNGNLQVDASANPKTKKEYGLATIYNMIKFYRDGIPTCVIVN